MRTGLRSSILSSEESMTEEPNTTSRQADPIIESTPIKQSKKIIKKKPSTSKKYVTIDLENSQSQSEMIKKEENNDNTLKRAEDDNKWIDVKEEQFDLYKELSGISQLNNSEEGSNQNLNRQLSEINNSIDSKTLFVSDKDQTSHEQINNPQEQLANCWTIINTMTSMLRENIPKRNKIQLVLYNKIEQHLKEQNGKAILTYLDDIIHLNKLQKKKKENSELAYLQPEVQRKIEQTSYQKIIRYFKTVFDVPENKFLKLLFKFNYDIDKVTMYLCKNK